MEAKRWCETVAGKPEVAGETVDPCPHLHRVGAGPLYPELAYCFALAGGRLMLPSSDELERLCTSGHHTSCPIFRANRAVYRSDDSAP